MIAASPDAGVNHAERPRAMNAVAHVSPENRERCAPGTENAATIRRSTPKVSAAPGRVAQRTASRTPGPVSMGTCAVSNPLDDELAASAPALAHHPTTPAAALASSSLSIDEADD